MTMNVMEKRLEGLKVAILVTHGFEQVELTEPRKALDASGAVTHIVAPEAGQLKAWNHKDWGDMFDVDRSLEQINPDDYDALLLPGGVLNPDKLRMNEKAVQFVRAFFEQNKPVAAICHGPQMLIEAGVVHGRRMTSYPAVRTDLQNAGAQWVDKPSVVDGPLVTSRKPDDIPDFNKAMIGLFARAMKRVALA